MNFFNKIVSLVARRENLWVYYPVFISTAFFLYWSFDSSILTLLWVAEAFVIFVVSVILKENHFRYVSMIGIVICIIRLGIYDLAKSGTVTRIIVCLGVGGIMIFMNTLFKPYTFKHGAVMRNHFALAPMTTYASNPDLTLSEEEEVYYSSRAKEFGMIITAATAVSKNAQAFQNQISRLCLQ